MMFSDITFAPTGILLRILMLILVLCQMSIFIMAMRSRTGAGLKALSTVVLFLGAALFTLMLDGTFDSIRWNNGAVRISWPDAVEFIYGLHWIWILLFEIILAIVTLYGLIRIRKKQKMMIYPGSIKEAMDGLPIGLLFSDKRGDVVMLNLRMKEYTELLKKNLPDLNGFWDIVASKGRESNGKYAVDLDDGRTIYFEKTKVFLDGEELDQITAGDITEQTKITEELREKNAKLLDVQYRMKAYQAREAEMFMNQELLNARVAVHDGLGGVLLTMRHYLEEPGSVDEKELLQMLRESSSYLLSDALDRGTTPDPYERAIKGARSIGIEPKIRGEVPDDPALREILGRIVSECAANAVKHAGADELEIDISYDDKAYMIRVSNNGDLPEGSVHESGGLRSLRHMIEKMGGSMEITTDQRFSLSIAILKDKISF